jgi:hypothetical protein
MGQNPPLCGQLGAARSHQDESKEVGGVGSKRTSSGCNGVHVVRWIGLIFRLLFVWTWRMLHGDCGRWMAMDGPLHGLRERLVSSATA